MLQAMYNGVSGLSAEQQWMDTIGNNIANVNTTGYKSSSVAFEDQLSQTLQGASSAGTNVGGTNAVQIGLGVKLGSIGINTSQGGLQSTSKPTDMAVSGNGYFMVGDGNQVSYTRDGSFALDNQGNLVSSATGGYVLGWTADSKGNIDSSQQIDGASHLQIPVGAMTITNPTANAAFSGNLSADAPTSTNPTGTYTRSVNMYDSLGEKQAVTLTFNNESVSPPSIVPTNASSNATGGSLNSGDVYKLSYAFVYPDGSQSAVTSPAVSVTAAGVAPANVAQINVTGIQVPAGATVKWYMGDSSTPSPQKEVASTDFVDNGGGSFTLNATGSLGAIPANPSNQWAWAATDSTGATIGSGHLAFDTNGATTSTGSVTLTPSNGSGNPQSVALDFSALTQISGASSAAPSSQDGSAPGTLTGFNVDNTGTITGTFSNGLTRALGQVALANFQNPGGLTRQGNNEFATSPNSGEPTVGTAGNDGLGGVASGFTELSNVDLSKEFSNLIVSQRGFEANTKIVSTVDTLLSDVIHLVQ